MIQQLPGAETVRGVFQDVLADPAFQQPRTSLAERIVRLVWDALESLFGRWLPTVGDSTFRVLALILVGAATVWTLVVVWRRTADDRSSRGSRHRAVPTTGPRSAGEWARRARGAQGEGRLREAATGLYQAVVLHLETRGVLRYGEWKTPGDYALELSEGAAAAPFEAFLALFVEVAFGPQEPTAESLEALFQRAEGLGCPT